MGVKWRRGVHPDFTPFAHISWDATQVLMVAKSRCKASEDFKEETRDPGRTHMSSISAHRGGLGTTPLPKTGPGGISVDFSTEKLRVSEWLGQQARRQENGPPPPPPPPRIRAPPSKRTSLGAQLLTLLASAAGTCRWPASAVHIGVTKDSQASAPDGNHRQLTMATSHDASKREDSRAVRTRQLGPPCGARPAGCRRASAHARRSSGGSVLG